MATVDVIVPCYGYAHYLVECVASILDQGIAGIRVLIIDDASPDDTAEVAAALARQDGRITFDRHRVNRGHIATYNEGIDWACADYMLLLSADDLLLPGALARAAALLDAHPDVGLTYGPFLELQPGQPLSAVQHPAARPGWTILSRDAFFHANRLANPVGVCTAVVRTAMQKQVGFYRPELPHAGDMEMWLRFAANGPVGRLNAHQGAYRRHASNMSQAYVQDPMRDLQQRKAVFDFVFEQYGAQMDTADALRHTMYSGLARSALKCAGQPFSLGNLRRFEAILDFAVQLDPAITRSVAWKLQELKRLLGPRVWAALMPARNLVHGLSRRAAL